MRRAGIWAVVAWAWVSWAVPAAAEPQVAELSAARALIGRAFAAGPERSGAARVEGVQAARAARPGRLRALEVGVAPGWEVTRSTIGPVSDSVGGAALEWEVSPTLQSRADARWAAQHEAERSGQDAARWRYERQGLLGCVDLWAARTLALHLGEDLEGFDAALAPVRRAAQEGHLSPLEAGEFEVARAQLKSEVDAAWREAQRLEAELETSLGVALGSVASMSWEEPTAARLGSLRANPWSGLAAALTGEHPAVRAAQQKGEAQRAEAAALEAWPLGLTVGVDAHRTGDVVWLAGRVGLVIPLAAPSAPEARVLRAEADALELEAARGLAAHGRLLEQEEATWERDRQRLLTREAELIAPLEERAARLQQSWAAGQVEVQRLIWARRELHEARHEQLLLGIALQSSALRAEIERLTLAPDGGPGVPPPAAGGTLPNIANKQK